MSARARLAAVVGLVVFSILAGTTASWAYWATQLHATSSASRATLGVAITGFDTGAAATYSNSTLATTGAVTFTNTTVTSSTTAGTVTATVTGSGALASKVKLTVWAPSTNAASSCDAAATPTAPSVLNTWDTAGGVTLTFPLAPSAAKVYCLRSEVQGGRIAVTTTSGTQSFTPAVSAQLKLGNLTATASATATQQTKNIFPVTTLTTGKWFWMRPSYSNDTYQYCADMNGGATTSGTIVISYGCKDTGSTNQMWSFEAGTGTYASYVRIIPRNSPTLRVDTNAGSSSITANTGSGTDAGQYWVPQITTTGTVQFVNYVSGLCLSAPVGNVQNNGNVTQAECVVGDGQQWILSRTLEPQGTAAQIGTSTTANGSATATANFAWDSTGTDGYTAQVTVNGGQVALPLSANSATGLSFTGDALYAANGGSTAATTFTVYDRFGTRVGIGSAKVARSQQFSFTTFSWVTVYTLSGLSLSGIQ